MFRWVMLFEAVVQLSQQKPDDTIHVGIDLKPEDVTATESKATYDDLKTYIEEKYAFKVSSLYIAQAKTTLGVRERENYNKPKTQGSKKLVCPPEKMAAIQEALRHFQMISKEFLLEFIPPRMYFPVFCLCLIDASRLPGLSPDTRWEVR